MPGQAQDATPFELERVALPEGAVFSAPGNCVVSPDETQIAVDEYGVFSLPDGEKRYDITGYQSLYSPDGRHDVETETLILPMTGLHGLALTLGGTYVVSQNPCTIWTLP